MGNAYLATGKCKKAHENYVFFFFIFLYFDVHRAKIFNAYGY